MQNEELGTLFPKQEEYDPVVEVKYLWNKSRSNQISFTAYLSHQCEGLTINMTTSSLSSHEENKYLGMS